MGRVEGRLLVAGQTPLRRRGAGGCKVLNLPGNDVSTYLDGLKARARRAQARLKAIGVPIP